MKQPIRAIIVGAGHRSLIYASLADRHPERKQSGINGIIHLISMREDKTGKAFNSHTDF